MLAAITCCIGNFHRHEQWLYAVSFSLAGVAALLFVATGLVLIATSSGRSRPTNRLRPITALWWRNAAPSEKIAIVMMLGVGIVVTLIGILGAAQHADLVAHGANYYVVTDAGRQRVSQATYDGLMYSQYVLGVLGPAMALSAFVLLTLGTFQFAAKRPDLRTMEEALTGHPRVGRVRAAT